MTRQADLSNSPDRLGNELTPELTQAAYLTAVQVGKMLQLSAKSIYRLANDDPTMPMLKIGGTVRFPKERLERWLRDREQGRPHTRSLSAVPPKSSVTKEMRSV
jgi:excisionase family DNA binding protein